MTKEDEKMIACRCEDISVQEIKDAIRSGYADLQSLKRYANFGLGPCQDRTYA
jgi:bacterioferritin-associated ferredoxin